MTYWWVNHNKTARYETGRGFMWSPKRRRNGTRNEYYNNMYRLIPGDRVFSFHGSHLRKVGVVQDVAITARRPREFDHFAYAWAEVGWQVPVHWDDLPRALHPAAHIEQLRQYLPAQYSPILPESGNGKPAYLARISNDLAREIFGLLGATEEEILNPDPGTVGQRNIANEADRAMEHELWNDDELDDTEKETIAKARIGQGQFRNNVSRIEPICRVTGVRDPQFLRAGHIKPWRDCNNYERLDGNNGLMLAPNIDHLFDKGYIAFEANGRMLISKRVSGEQLGLLGVYVDQEYDVGEFSEEQEVYLSHHRQQIYRR